jgi:capsular exopolysaccharide synthesis family protein
MRFVTRFEGALAAPSEQTESVVSEANPVQAEGPPQRRIFEKLSQSLRRQRHVVVMVTLLTVLSALCYQVWVPTAYFVRGTIEFRPQGRSSRGADLIDAVYSSDVLSNALRQTSGLTLGVMRGADPVAALREQLRVKFDFPNNRLEIGLSSSYRHQAAQTVNAVMDALLKQRKAGTKDSAGALVVDPETLSAVSSATADVAPIGWSISLSLLVSAMIGLPLGLAVALYRGLVDRRIGSPEQIQERAGICTAGYLPTMPSGSSPAGRGLASYIDPTSEVAVRSRSLLLQLLGAKVSRRSGSLLITSPAAGEGRSTVALNLAATVAMTGESVLLVDADLQSPVLHKMFSDVNASPGFCDALDNPSIAGELVQATHVKGLDVLVCGKPSSAAAAKLQSKSLKEVLATLRDKYRYVLFDGGPVFDNPDTLALAVRCDAVLMVLHAQRTDLAAAAQATKLLKRRRFNQVVAVVNALPNDARRAQFDRGQSRRPAPKPVPTTYSDIHDYGLAPTA